MVKILNGDEWEDTILLAGGLLRTASMEFRTDKPGYHSELFRTMRECADHISDLVIGSWSIGGPPVGSIAAILSPHAGGADAGGHPVTRWRSAAEGQR